MLVPNEMDALAAYARDRSSRTRASMPWLRLRAFLRGARGRLRLEEGLGRIALSCDCAASGRRHLVVYCHNIGEVRTALPLVSELRARAPHVPLVIVTKSVVARSAAADLMPGACGVFYAPMDDTECVVRALQAVAPCCGLCILEGDVRPTMVEGARQAGVPTALISGGLSPVEMARHAGEADGQRAMLEAMALLALKGSAEAEMARALGVPEEHIFVSGNCRYDVLGCDLALTHGSLTSLLEEARANGRRVIVAGSTYKLEELALARALPALLSEFPDLLLVVAPRNVARADQVSGAFAGWAQRIARRTELSLAPKANALQVLVLDTMGELAGTYAYGDLCFVGGSLVSKGGHNVIEAAVHGVPVVFGPSLFNNEDIAARLLELRGGVLIETADALEACLCKLLRDDVGRERMGLAASQAVRENAGAVARTLERLLPIIQPDEER